MYRGNRYIYRECIYGRINKSGGITYIRITIYMGEHIYGGINI